MKFSSKVFFSLISATFIFAAGCDDSTTKCTAKCDGQTALSCDKNGKETKKTCTAEQKCEVNTKANTASCKAKSGGNGGGGNSGTEPQKGADCTKESVPAACNEAKNKGWRCNVKKGETQGKVHVEDCPQNNCQVDATGWLSCGPRENNGGGGNGGEYKDCDATQAHECDGLTGVKCLVTPAKRVICAVEPEQNCTENKNVCDGNNLKGCWLTDLKNPSKGGKVTLRKCADGCENNQCKGSGTYTDCSEQQMKSCEGLANTKCQVAPNGKTVLCFKEPEEKCGQDFKESCKGEGAEAVATRCWKTNLSDAEGRINLQKCKNGCDAQTGKCAKK